MYTVQQIADALGAETAGDLSLRVTGLAEPDSATKDQLALAMDPKYADKLAAGSARVAMLWEGADWEAYGLEAAIFPARPRFAMSGLTRMMDPGAGYDSGIHPSAVIDPDAILGENVSVGPLAVISRGARIGAGSVIGPLVFIGVDAVIGENALLREHASIGAGVRIGDRFIAQPGARVGGDGFSYVTPEPSTVEQARKTLGDRGDTQAQDWARIHSLGAVHIGHDVELGMGATIDRGTIRNTIVGDNTKLDNQAHLGHNTVVGRNCLLCGQVGVAGSVRIGDNVVLGGKVGVGDNIFIGEGVIAGGGTNILSNVPAGRTILGYPATQMDKQMEIYKNQRKLPRILRDIAALQKAVFKPGTGD